MFDHSHIVNVTWSHVLRIWWAWFWRTWLPSIILFVAMFFAAFAWFGAALESNAASTNELMGVGMLTIWLLVYLTFACIFLSLPISLLAMRAILRKRFRTFRLTVIDVERGPIVPKFRHALRTWWLVAWRFWLAFIVLFVASDFLELRMDTIGNPWVWTVFTLLVLGLNILSFRSMLNKKYSGFGIVLANDAPANDIN